MRVERFEWEGARRDRGRDPRLGLGVGAAGRRRARSSARGRRGRRRGACCDLTAASTRPSSRRARCGSTRRRAPAALAASIPSCARRSSWPRPTSAPSPRRRSSAEQRRGRAAPGADGRRSARSRSSPPASTRRAGSAAYPSSVLMCAIPARVAGVERIALASPPRPDGRVNPLVLAAAALCGVDEIYAMGGAQAIFALAYGTETIAPVDVDRRPRQRLGAGGEARGLRRGRDRLPRRALGADGRRRARHRPRVGGARPLRPGRARRRAAPLVAVAVEEAVLDAHRRGDRACRRRASGRRATRRWRWSRCPTSSDAIDLANAFAPEHLELLEEDAALLAEPGARPPAASSPAATAPPPSATTSPAPTTSCRPAAPGASRARSAPAPSAARSRRWRFRPTRRRSLPRTSRRSPAPRASPSTASRR